MWAGDVNIYVTQISSSMKLIVIEGRESSYPFQMFSVAIGKYKRDGVLGLLKTFSNKMMNKMMKK